MYIDGVFSGGGVKGKKHRQYTSHSLPLHPIVYYHFKKTREEIDQRMTGGVSVSKKTASFETAFLLIMEQY